MRLQITSVALSFLILTGCSTGSGTSGDVAPALDGSGETVADVPTDTGTDVPTDTEADVPPDTVADVPPDTTGPWFVEATLGTRCALNDRVGVVQISEEGYLYAFAEVFDVPHPWYSEPALSDEACFFHEFSLLAPCDPCGDDELCGRDGICAPAQKPVMGMLMTISNGATEQVLEADPVFGRVGGEVELEGSSFSLELTLPDGSLTLALTEVPGEIQDIAGTLLGDYSAPEGIDLSWDPVLDGGQVFTHIHINHHAGGPTFTECAVDASAGALHVDGAMLVPLAVSTGLEFQGVAHVRFAAAQIPSGCIEFAFSRHHYVDLGY